MIKQFNTRLIYTFSLFLFITTLSSQLVFERGNIIFFHDNMKDETVGEFPSRWKLHRGAAEIAIYKGEKVLSFLNTRTEVSPCMGRQNYLPKSFTIEFYYLMNHFTQHNYEIVFFNRSNRTSSTLRFNGRSYSLRSSPGGSSFERSTPETSNTFEAGWKRLALSYNRNEMKVFCDGVLILNVPNFDADLSGFLIKGGRSDNARPNKDAFIKNVIIAEGGMSLYERVISQGTFITNEILFDVNRAEIKPQSMTIINQISDLMKTHRDLVFSVEGHTDSDGDSDWNQRLSLMRAESVVKKLIDLGIEKYRLSAKGWGASRPVADNSTVEGKALNRRVEFLILKR